MLKISSLLKELLFNFIRLGLDFILDDFVGDWLDEFVIFVHQRLWGLSFSERVVFFGDFEVILLDFTEVGLRIEDIFEVLVLFDEVFVFLHIELLFFVPSGKFGFIKSKDAPEVIFVLEKYFKSFIVFFEFLHIISGLKEQLLVDVFL